MADEIEFLSTKNDAEGNVVSPTNTNESSTQVADLQPIDDDSLPF